MFESQEIIEKVKRWLEHIVIQYNFCPFAKKPFKQNKIRYFVSAARNEEALIDDLMAELMLLQQTDIKKLETSIVIVPNVFHDFESYNQFGAILDHLITSLKLQGIIQIATFHPDYQFADLDAEDVRNYTNRSPYPLFHLIREDSVEQARKVFPDIENIPENNMKKLQDMGLEKIKDELAKL